MGFIKLTSIHGAQLAATPALRILPTSTGTTEPVLTKLGYAVVPTEADTSSSTASTGSNVSNQSSVREWELVQTNVAIADVLISGLKIDDDDICVAAINLYYEDFLKLLPPSERIKWCEEALAKVLLDSVGIFAATTHDSRFE